MKNSILNLVDSYSSNLTAVPSGGLYVFVTSYTDDSSASPLIHNGNFAGISGADAYCNSHIPSGLPSIGYYKAMLVYEINRVATTVGPNSLSGQKDWVFEKNTSYYRPDGKMVFATNDAGLFDFSAGSLSDAFADSFYVWDFGI
ncbi:PF07588 family protein [Leptospira weilii serovar Topaz str. LT2116]|uniref:PF07588 family protein n=1 Tax=Leptospira weilii serovar Topaz str. LT2116 TaxID=1088540 RepID=M3GCC5_9LEPT|nr:PF07588 family protein [Leptospira weilii serovar Topaz str. LT2116]